MTLAHIFVFSLISLPFNLIIPRQHRTSALLILSMLAVGWMMIRLDTPTSLFFFLVTVALAWLVWWVGVAPQVLQSARIQRFFSIRCVLALCAGIGVLLFSLRNEQAVFVTLYAALFLTVPVYGFGVMARGQVLSAGVDSRASASLALIALIVVLLLMLKTPAIISFAGSVLYSAQGNAVTDGFVWLGFSYVAFRLISVLLDFRAGRLKAHEITLKQFLVYVFFFPAYTAGPIDRLPRFIDDLESEAQTALTGQYVEGITRILVGAFKKFVVADTIAVVALSPTLVEASSGAAALWVMTYIYAIRIFLDFSGYSDIAIGLGRLYGLKLPENFDRPYLQPNIQRFWQHWHMTLSTWFRLYYFTPLSRWMLQSRVRPPQWVQVLIAQVSTMVLIGLWHGVSVNFVAWGLWHGLGLFAFKLISDNTRGFHRRMLTDPTRSRVMSVLNIIITFHFVLIGWVFFALPQFDSSLSVLGRMFGLGS